MLTKKTAERIRLLKEENLFREPRIFDKAEGIFLFRKNKKIINFSSNDILGIAGSNQVKEILANNILKYGSSASSSRLVSAGRQSVKDVEMKFARHFGFEDCLFFNSGFQANSGLFSSLFSEDDTVLYDKRIHASIVTGIKASGAKSIGFNHNKISHMERRIKANAHISVAVAEALYSMDGDFLDDNFFETAKKNNIFTVVDEAHSVGAYGEAGKGINKGDIVVGTMGKAFGLFGAFILLPEIIKEYLLNKCREIIYTTMLPEAVIVTAGEILDIIADADDKRKRLRENTEFFKNLLQKNKINYGGNSHIVPIFIGEEKKAVQISNRLFEKGFHALASRYPSVPLKKAILRVTVTSEHKKNDIKNFINIFGSVT
ncbi:MAG: 8-amino-7-oxononanoate synthase [Candidatus Cloacimonadota bacterium]|nr:MAG: 8-amino-7-oxononanoate synthase [Candidatus Cloacimonadota bacterium]